MKIFLKAFFSIGFVLAVSVRCSSTADFKSITPPYESQIYSQLEEKDPVSVEIHLRPYLNDSKRKETYYWANYKMGQVWASSNSKKACKYFSLLADDKDFPLKELAYLKEIETCPMDSKKLNHLFELDPNDKHKWLGAEISELRYEVSKSQKLYEEWAEAAIRLSKDSVIRNEKIKYTEEALRLAKSLKQKDKIEQYQTRLEKLSPSRKKNFRKNDYFKVAYDYRRDRKFDKAMALYKKILRDKKRSFEEKVKAWKGIQSSHKLNRDKEKHLKAMFSLAAIADRNYRKNKNNKRAQKIHHDAQIALARALWTLGKVSKARKVLETLAKWLKGSYPLDQTYWLIARMEEERTNYKAATQFAKLSIKEAPEKSSYEEKSRWILAWNLKRVNKPYEAIKQFKKLLETTDNIYDEKKYKFWLAHTYQQVNNKLDAYQTYKELGEEDPLGYYGLLSFRQRGEKFPKLSGEKSRLMGSMDKLPLERGLISQVQWLIAVDEYKLAQNYLKQLRVKTKDQDSIHDLYHLYIRAGHYAGIFRSLAKLPPGEKRELVEQNPEYLFPRPYISLINEASREHGVDPALIYSIIRQESSFIPHARSFADAFGLMQLIPKQAKRLAGKHQVKYKTAEDLYKPHINIPLGAAFLRELWDRKQGQFILTAASYNASERAVMGWVNTRYFGNPITFIEDIPYNETKGYIKLVLRNYIWYKRLSHSHEQLSFPEWTLQGLAKFKK